MYNKISIKKVLGIIGTLIIHGMYIYSVSIAALSQEFTFILKMTIIIVIYDGGFLFGLKTIGGIATLIINAKNTKTTVNVEEKYKGIKGER